MELANHREWFECYDPQLSSVGQELRQWKEPWTLSGFSPLESELDLYKQTIFLARTFYFLLLFSYSHNISTTMEEPVRIGIIGTGVFAYRHMRAYKAVGEDKFKIVACANRSRDKAEKFAKEVGQQRENLSSKLQLY